MTNEQLIEKLTSAYPDAVVKQGSQYPEITVSFDNQDSGIPHNFAVYQDNTAAEQIFKGDIVVGPRIITYTFTAPTEPGSYFFRCDVHPEVMTGTFVVT